MRDLEILKKLEYGTSCFQRNRLARNQILDNEDTTTNRMATMLGNKEDNRLIRECWNQWNETHSRTSYIRSQSDQPHSNLHESTHEENGQTHAIPFPRNLNGRAQAEIESNEMATSRSFPRNFSDPNSLVDLPLLGEEEQRNTKLRKTVSSDAAGLEKLVAINSVGHKMPPKPKQEQKWFSNQVLKKGTTVLSRRASLPSSYLGNFLSVNNIRKRAISSATDDAEEAVVLTNTDGRLPSQNSTRRAKNAGRKKVRPHSNEEHLVSEKEVTEAAVPAIEVEDSTEKMVEHENSGKQLAVGFVTSLFSLRLTAYLA